MKTKTKIVVLVEIAIVLCSVFLVAIPAIAAEQTSQEVSIAEVTTASEDKTLEIYGNANEDDTIDMGDVVYTKLAIFGKKPKTELCDAKYDGRINVLDVIQTKLIILGKEKELTFVDSYDRIVTVKKPVNTVVPTGGVTLETVRSCGVGKDRIIGRHVTKNLDMVFFSEFSDVPSVDKKDPESIITLHPDIVLLSSRYDSTADACEAAGIAVFRHNFNDPHWYIYGVKLLGYILDTRKETEEFIDWHEDIMNTIKERVDRIPEEDKPKVFFESIPHSRPYVTHSMYVDIESTGGKNIFPGVNGQVDPEAVIDRDPDFIITRSEGGGYGVDADDTTELKKVREDIMSRPELENVAAVKTGRVCVINSGLTSWYGKAGAKYFLQHVYFAKWFHPELFKDLDPKALHQEYLDRFQRIDYDLDEHGVFVYPPLED